MGNEYQAYSKYGAWYMGEWLPYEDMEDTYDC